VTPYILSEPRRKASNRSYLARPGSGFQWAKDDVERNLFAKVYYPGSRPYDPESVMNYKLPLSILVKPEMQTRPGKHLSNSDKRYISSLYPPK
jgi:hypothetical protein